MRPWAVIAKKEVREQLRSKRTLASLVIVPIGMWLLVGLMHAFMFGMMTPESPLATPMDMHLTVEDQGVFGQIAKEVILTVAGNMNVIVHEVPADEGKDLVEKGDTVLYVLIPEDFTERLLTENRSRVEIWVDMTSTRASAVAQAIMVALKETIEQRRFHLEADQKAIRKLPLTLMMLSLMLITSAIWGPMPFITTSFAGEREKKTLEVLLVTPVERRSILLGKLLAAGFAAAIYMGSSMVGLVIYNSLVGWATAGVMEEFTSPTLTLEQAAVILLAAVLTVLLSASVGIVISCLARSVKDAESYYSAIFMLTVMPLFGVLWMRFEDLPLALRAFMLAVPFTHGILIVNNAVIYGLEWQNMAISIAYMLAWSIGALVLGAKLFEREEIVETRRIRRFRKPSWLRKLFSSR